MLAVRSAAMQTWAAVKKALQHDDEAQLAPARQEQALRSMSELRLAHLVHPIDWDEVSLALDAKMAMAPASKVIFVVGPPFCGHAEIVSAWAERHKARQIDPPSPAQILSGERQWLPPWDKQVTWALPRLERCFLRHANGLALVRQLLEDVAMGRAGTGLIGCDSWAWAFLQRVWPVPQGDALVLQALDAERLQRLLVHLSPTDLGGKLLFRDARSGRVALTVPWGGEARSEEIAQLAAHCRGNPGLAREYWRARLRTEPDTDAAESAADDAAEVAPDERVVWLSTSQNSPGLPSGADEDIALLLHALLLHGGLSGAMLTEVLPLPQHQCLALLVRLERQALVELRNGCWFVTPLAYTQVRTSLRGRDIQTDAL